MKEQADVCIIGAGPAGINAAGYLAEYGVQSVIIDEAPKLGGAVYRGPFRDNATADHLEKKLKKETENLRSLFAQHSTCIQVLTETRVVGFVGNPRHLMVYNDDMGLHSLHYKKLLICTGCFERTIPFPGWTLPGIITLGGLQSQVKNCLVKPDKSVVLVGTGPLLLVTAKQLHLAGVKVLGIYESGTRLQLAKQFSATMRNLPLVAEGLGYLRFLKKAGIDVFYGWSVVEVHGKDSLDEVVVAPFNSSKKPILEKSKTIPVNTLGVGFGFTSRSRLARLLGTQMVRSEESGSFPKVDKWYRTSLPGVYVAGDVAGTYGAKAAAAEGKVAALAALIDSGIVSQSQAAKKARPIWKEIKKNKDFRKAFREFSSVKKNFLQLPREDTIVCACENVTRKQIDDAIARGVQDIKTLKMVSRISMGDCQGKRCGEFCRDYLKDKLNKGNVGELEAQFPLSLISFDAIVKGERA